MTTLLSPERLARFSTRRPWAVVAIWTVFVALGAVLATNIGSVLTTEMGNAVEKDSDIARRLIDDHFGVEKGQEYVVVQSATATVDDLVFRQKLDAVAVALRANGDEVAAVVTYTETGDNSLVSKDRKTALLPVVLRGEIGAEAQDDAAKVLETTRAFDGKDGFTVVTGGVGSVSKVFTETSEKDAQRGEMIGLPVALVVLVIVFGALVAAGLPVGLAVVSIVIAIGVSSLVGQAFELSIFVVNMITMIGLAVGIDYSLLIVQRVREERSRGLSRDDAIVRAGATASRAVVFSGLAVIVALLGLLIVPNTIYRSMAAGAIIVVSVALMAATTLLPAALHLLGDKINRGRVRIPGRKPKANGEAGAFWSRTSNLVMRHAVLSVILSVGLLLGAASPLLGIRLGSAGVSTLPADTDAARAFAILDKEFFAGIMAPTEVVVRDRDVTSGSTMDAIGRLQASIEADGHFGPATVTASPDGQVAVVSAPLIGDSTTNGAKDAIKRIRDEYVPAASNSTSAQAYVGGDTAITMDAEGVITQYTPIVFAFVLGLSFIILMVVFRSIVVPLKAIIMNLLSVGAAYGLLVLIFQQGVGNELFGFSSSETIEAWIPLFLFAIVFGLSMDYHVFLLTRIRERFDETGDNRASVAFGVRTTAGMITGAALIMVAVFAGFAAGDLIPMQQLGFGLAVAVIIDATIVRTILVPASMALLGNVNWYLPSWLNWLPEVNVEGVPHLATTPIEA
ncbi:MAG: MMPL family transporter [Anaerolinea sp.]|nr:MMPL family transporter [Anaerolinea sp.]